MQLFDELTLNKIKHSVPLFHQPQWEPYGIVLIQDLFNITQSYIGELPSRGENQDQKVDIREQGQDSDSLKTKNPTTFNYSNCLQKRKQTGCKAVFLSPLLSPTQSSLMGNFIQVSQAYLLPSSNNKAISKILIIPFQ